MLMAPMFRKFPLTNYKMMENMVEIYRDYDYGEKIPKNYRNIAAMAQHNFPRFFDILTVNEYLPIYLMEIVLFLPGSIDINGHFLISFLGHF